MIIIVIIMILTIVAVSWALHALKPKTTIHQAKPVEAKISYDTKTKHFDEGDFTVDFPLDWQLKPRPVGPYKSFTWQSSDRITDGQIIVFYEDTIPINFAVNRVLIVDGEVDHLILDGAASDNCSKYTNGVSPKAYQVGAPAKWQGIEFLCDQANQQRDTIGTSSTDGINTVVLKSPGSGTAHKFFFTYTDNAINPDYSVFYNVLNSFRMQ